MNIGSLVSLALLLCCTVALAQSTQPMVAPIFRDGDRVLFQGDSITDGGRGRSADPNHVLGQDYAYLIAARHGLAFPERGITFLNRGISGNRIDDLAKRWRADAIDLRPDVVSILVGINDVGLGFQAGEGVDVVAFERAYDQLLADTVAARPGVRLILMEPFVAPGARTSDRLNDWQQTVGQLRDVIVRLGDKYHAPVVHLQRAFDEAAQRAPMDHWIWDGVHPTYAGHALIAEEWCRAYEAAYGSPPPTTRPTFVP